MSEIKGLINYEKYWEDQVGFMDTQPWDQDKILRLTILSDFRRDINELNFSTHLLTIEDDKIILRLKVPYNYSELDDFKIKAIQLLGINNSWLIDSSIDNSHCTNRLKK